MQNPRGHVREAGESCAASEDHSRREGRVLTRLKHAEHAARLRDSIGGVIRGKADLIEMVLAGLLARGHILLEDVPGTGKTLLAKALARSVGGEFRRVQFTPDLLPSDVTGSSVYNEHDRTFEFQQGPVFANVFLGDELNRATPRTQSSLLEAMEERQVTVDGVTHRLPDPFMVLATQNPVEQQGVYPLPEAQLDRFMMRLRVGYPDAQTESEIVMSQLERSPVDSVEPVASLEEVLMMQREVRQVHVDETVTAYAVALATATRRHTDLDLGASPRASLALVLTAQALSYLGGSVYVIPDMVKRAAPAVLPHRLLLRPQTILSGASADSIVAALLEEVPLPLRVP